MTVMSSSKLNNRSDEAVDVEAHREDVLSSLAEMKSYGRTLHGQNLTRSDQEVLGLLSREVFHRFLRDPKCIRAFIKFLQVDRSIEGLNFWHRVNKIGNNQSSLRSLIMDTYDKFVEGQEKNFNTASWEDLKRVPAFLDILEMNFLKAAQEEVFERMYTQSFFKFIRLYLVFTAQAAMAQRERQIGLGGLGDCFCLTDALLEDNPIVLASDRFVEVSGYQRSECIAINCRFLQGPLTDREAINRLRNAIAHGDETTELFLNYRKDGTPFWNLVFIAPLRKHDGTIRYFLGGQVDVTGSLEIDKQLPALMAEPSSISQKQLEPQNKVQPAQARGSAIAVHETKNNFFSRVWNWFTEKLSRREFREQKVIGMEAEVAGTSELSSQVVKLYDTYSKYLLLHPNRGEILFAGWQLSEMLQRPHAKEGWMIGADFYQLVVGPKTPKSAIAVLQRCHHGALPASEVIVTPTTNDMVESRMMAHMTPLKDANDNCGAVVVILVPVEGDIPDMMV